MFKIKKDKHSSYFMLKRCHKADMPQSEQYCYSCPSNFLLKAGNVGVYDKVIYFDGVFVTFSYI